MATDEKKRLTVITNHELEHREKHKYKSDYQTDPMREKFMKFVNNEGGRRFSVEDLLNW